jgi:hypothetical protein
MQRVMSRFLIATHVQIVSAHDTRSPADVESAAALDSKALHSPACAIIARPSPRDWLRGRSMRIVHSTGGTEAARVAVLDDLGRGGCIVHGPLRTVAVICVPLLGV